MKNRPEEKPKPSYMQPQNYQIPPYRQQQPQFPYPQTQQAQYEPSSYGNFPPPPRPPVSPPQFPPKPPRARLTPSGRFALTAIIVIFIVGMFLEININHANPFSFSVNATPTPSQIGDTITVDGVSCTVVSTQGPLNQSELGYSLVDVKIVNNSNGEIRYNASDFHLVVDSGNLIDADSSSSSLQIVSGALIPGGSIEGSVSFALYNVTTATLIWQPNSTDDLSHAWKVKF